ncbi:hypothetical protein J1C56_13720 [Aminobacter anthyllidis]|uniref:Uncharacterized protein n=1 Tax=Aminobacter anthyllidis TaxID=1035067 RepID=A0A9X1AB80_9HYPH|nr:hypothetical protein [Aminobacter anthyllidis]MBT1156653.1 hypothetical protein [Aminobacter anthyllidis]
MLPNLRQGAHFLDAPDPLQLLMAAGWSNFGKLCRNPFSTIKLTDEDGGSMARTAVKKPGFAQKSHHFAQGLAAVSCRMRRRCVTKSTVRPALIRTAGLHGRKIVVQAICPRDAVHGRVVDAFRP